MKSRFAIIPALLAVMACGNETQKSEEAPAAPVVPNVEITKAQTSIVPQESTYPSTVQAYAVNNIMPQAGGRIRKINVEVGDYVQKGQILAEMDRLQLDQLSVQIANDDIEYERLKSLYAEGGVSQSDFETAEMSYKLRKINYENTLENTILRSPITGFVTARNFDAGDMFSLSAPLFTVQQVTPVKLLVGISESEYAKVKKGDQVSLTVDALPGRTFKGKVERLYPIVNSATHTVNVEVVVPNKDRALLPGMYARVTVNFGNQRSVVLPDQTVVRLEGTGQRFVYVLNQDQTVSYVPVTLGRRMGATYEILEGVQEGQQVVIKGQSMLKDGIKVQVLNNN